jgi:hypothetical protein
MLGLLEEELILLEGISEAKTVKINKVFQQ